MRVALHRVESDCLKPIFDKQIPKEETCELVVPDVCADIGKILDVRGQFLLTSQKSKADEIHINASVEITVIYAAEESGKVQFVSTNIPLDQTISVVGANENTKTTTRCELCSLDARALNPRKLLLRAVTSIGLCCYAPDVCVFWDNLSEGAQAPIHLLHKEVEHCLTIGIREKSFVVSDEYQLQQGKDKSSKMLSACTEICVDDAKSVGNKLIIKAAANTTAIFLNESDGSLFDEVFSSQFSQIIEVDTYGDNIENTVTIQLKDAEFTIIPGRENGFTVSAQLQMIAQAVCKENKNSMYVADAYSNKYIIEAETVCTKITKCMPTKTLKLSMRGKLQTKNPLTEIMYAAVTAVCTEINGNEIRCEIIVSGVGMAENEELDPIMLCLQAEEAIDLTKGQRLYISDVCCEAPVIIGVAQNAEINVDINLAYSINECMEIEAVCGIEINEDCPVDREHSPTLVVLCSDRDTDLWSLAKKYGSTMEMIENANSLDGDFSITRRPLLIPRAH